MYNINTVQTFYDDHSGAKFSGCNREREVAASYYRDEIGGFESL